MLYYLKLLNFKIRQLYNALHVLFDRYENIDAPDFNPDILDLISSDNSPFTKLLTGNSNNLSEADQIIQGQMSIYGRDFYFNDDHFHWHRDIFSGRTYPKVPYTLLSLVQNRKDHIISVWELSKLHFIPILIAAYKKTGNECYPKYYARVLDDWILNNPLHRGANWYCALDIAIRAFNMVLGIAYFRNSLENIDCYRRVLWAHILYLYNADIVNKNSIRNNHYLISVALLAVLTFVFEGGQAKAISAKAFEELSNEILIQFRSDGGNFESSIAYHQMSLEAVLIAAGLGQFDARFRFNDTILEVISKAVQLVKDYMTSFGQSPHFGDSCDGRIFVYEKYFDNNPADHSFIGNMSKVFVGNKIPAVKNGLYPDSGYGFWSNSNYGIGLNCSHATKKQVGGKGHGHCDKTSWVLKIKEQPVFVDSGTYCYIADVNKRSLYRSTRAHNVILIDDKEQAVFDQDLCFSPLQEIETSIQIQSDNGITQWRMEHNGYSSDLENIRIIRNIRCYEDYIIIDESILGQRQHNIKIQYHLHPSVSLKRSGNIIDIRFDDLLMGFMAIPDGFQANIQQTHYSSSYGRELSNHIIIFEKQLQLPVNISYKIVCKG